MNYATFKNPQTLAKIVRAMRNAQKWGIDHAINRKGIAFAAVRYNKETGRFTITDRKGRNLYHPLRYAAIGQRHGINMLMLKRVEGVDITGQWYSIKGRLVGAF